MELLKNMLTGKDNVTTDFMRVLACCSVVVALALEIYAVVWQHPFDIQAFGVGIGIVFGAAATALKIKETTEP